MRQFVIDGRVVNDDLSAFVVAEIGHNHAHDMTKAVAMIRSAKAVGASAVKFQTRFPKETYQANATRGAYFYESDNPQWMDRVYGKHREALEPTWDEWVALSIEAKRVGITFFSTPFDFKSLERLERLGVSAYKVASGDATNIPLIREIARTGKPTIISTGGCSIEDVDRLYNAFAHLNGDPQDLAILQCSCVYPATDEAMNLAVITTYRSRYPQTVIGLSTHNPSTIPSLAAFTLGARIFEHHYTNDRTWKGTDNRFSLNPAAMKMFVRTLEQTRKSLGTHIKYCTPVEFAPAMERQKSLVWARQLLDGETISRSDIKIQCPGQGIPPYYLDVIVGKQVSHVTGPNELVRWVDVLVMASEDVKFQAEAARV